MVSFFQQNRVGKILRTTGKNSVFRHPIKLIGALCLMVCVLASSLVFSRVATALTNSWGTIRASHSNKCIDHPWGATSGVALYTYSCHYQGNQLWYVSPLSIGGYSIKSYDLGNVCLSNNGNGANMAAISQITCANASTQAWDITVSQLSRFQIRNRYSGRCLDVYGSGTADGTTLIQYDCLGNPNQLFFLDFQLPQASSWTYGDEWNAIPAPPISQAIPPRNYTAFKRTSAATWSDNNVMRNSTGGSNENASLAWPFARIANDCVQFVSAAWHLGGNLPMNDAWYSRADQGFSGVGGKQQSATWTYVTNFANYWVGTGQATIYSLNRTTTYADSAKPGDVILADFNGDAIWDHVAIVSRYNSGAYSYYDPFGGTWYNLSSVDLIDSHNRDRLKAPWNIGYLNHENPNIAYAYLHWNGTVV
jgi:Ricin-type beta-trefoil lectin domain/Putative amidase domain